MQVNDCGTTLPPKSSRIFALLVGIDKYRNTDIPALSGCVNDCKNFAAFLLENLGVPEGNIRSLHNEAATRDAILGAIDSHLLLPKVGRRRVARSRLSGLMTKECRRMGPRFMGFPTARSQY
ncbi:hypothetical protein WOLCODRAFT_29237 [Wolfiporia cocos MD-104 SS10]|uniref:Peptidase C14 caspase domain-containing protein n=1 Tax=Wolfiporia cocos (strain MD-104) TaxID=742152 RepID=A0A2H3J9F0_WOLCO|nr:hypothetical protein WOLCODRAFT_29237 [Wolfiporia cocos MD-104 SS10]